MSKYIRTKDGVYEPYIKDYTFYVCKNGNKKVKFKNVIAEADTIEELCDEFVEETPIYKGNDVVGIDHQKWEYSKIRNCFENDLCEMRNHDYFIDEKYNFYGAVWCEFGLKYVAKLNSKGDLELI